MKPKIVENAERVPARCLVTSEVDGPFIDTGTYAGEMDPYIYLSVSFITEVARDLLGMVPKKEVEDLTEQVNALKVKLDQMEKVDDAIKVIQEFEAEKVLS